MADAKKVAYIRDLVRRIQELDVLFDDSADIEKEYFDLGYNDIGTNPIVDADVATYVLTQADIAAGITLIGAVKTLAVTHAATTNKFKRAPV